MTSEKKGLGEEYDSEDSPLAGRIKLKEEAAEILRKQLDNSINANESIHSELKKQLAFKEKELEALKAILLRKNLEVASLSKSLQAKKETDEYYVERLKEALLKKDNANKQIFSSLRQQLSAKDEENKKREISSFESSKSNEHLIKQLNEQLTQAYEQIDQLKNFVANETARSENLSNVFEKEIAEKEAIISELQKQKPGKPDNSELASKFEQAERKLKEKEAACRNLQMELAKLRFHHEDISRQLQEKGEEQDYSAYESQIGVLKMSIAEKDAEIKRLEASTFESGKGNERIARQLNAQLREAYSEVDRLKQFLSSEAVKNSGLEQEFDRQLAEKDARIAELEQNLRETPKPRSGREISELKQLLSVKEESYDVLQADLLKLKAQNTSLTKRLEANRKMIAESEENYAKFTDDINVVHQQRMKDLITKNAVNDAALRSEIEQLKAEMKKKDRLIEAETLKVDDALSQFSSKYQQLLKLRNYDGAVSQVEGMEKVRIEKDNMGALLKDAEAKLQRAIEREASVNMREQLLMKEQEGINRQLELLNAAGFEIGRTKEYLKKKLSEVPAPQSMASVMEEVVPRVRAEEVPEEIKMEIPAPERIIRQDMPKPEKPRLFQAKKEEFFNASTYSEIDEIKSMIEIATQQGDSLEQVRNSLLDSGYSKASIEKAFSSAQTIKR